MSTLLAHGPNRCGIRLGHGFNSGEVCDSAGSSLFGGGSRLASAAQKLPKYHTLARHIIAVFLFPAGS